MEKPGRGDRERAIRRRGCRRIALGGRGDYLASPADWAGFAAAEIVKAKYDVGRVSEGDYALPEYKRLDAEICGERRIKSF